MSRFDDMVADDFARISGESGDLGEPAQYLAAENTSQLLDVRVVFGDATDALQAMPEGTADNRTALASVPYAAIVATFGRLPQAGDTLLVAAGANTGTWRVVAVSHDQGGASNLSLRDESIFAAGRVGGR
jgi:hypothetical protein